MTQQLPSYVEYTDTRSPDVGAIPIHWSALPLRRVGRFIRAHGGSKADNIASGIACIRYGQLYTRYEFGIRQPRAWIGATRRASYTNVEHRDVLFALSGETIDDIGASAEVRFTEEAVCGGDLAILRPSLAFAPGFLGYACRARPSSIQKARTATGTTIKHTSASAIAGVLIPLPPLDDQSAIVRFLDHADRRIRRYIRAKLKLIKLLQEQKRAIIHQAVTRGLDPTVRTKPSGVEWLGEVPEHWRMLRLKHLSHRISGRLVYSPAQYFAEHGVPMVFANNVTERGIVLDHVKRIPEEINQRFEQHALRCGDVVTVRVGAPGLSAVVDERAEGLQFASLMVIRRSPKFEPKWLAAVLNSSIGKNQVKLVQYGAAQEQINIGDAINFLIPCPPKEEQEAIARRLDSLRARFNPVIDKFIEQVNRVREFRNRLVADVVTGKLDVRAAAAALPDEPDDPGDLAVDYDVPVDDDLDSTTEETDE